MKHYAHWIASFAWLLLLAACGPSDVESITVRGSDTEVNLALDLAETYMKKDSAISIAVTGGGSGGGIASLLNKKTDIANSSRPMQPKELEIAEERGVEPVDIIFAVDALAVVVHPAVTVDALTVEQIGQIFAGEITNWQEVGGADKDISLYGRQSNSGTFVFFRKNIIQGEYASSMKQMNGTAQIIESVKRDEEAIGYVGIGYIINEEGELMEGIKPLSIKPDQNAPAVSPTNREAINNGEYTITRPLFQFTDGVPTGKLLDFIQFELSEEGQQIVQRNGYFPITEKHRKHNEKLGIYNEATASN